MSSDWKDFLLKHKWMPTSLLVKRFGIARYDLDNFRRKPAVREILAPWHISLNQKSEHMQLILKEAWKYYLLEVVGMDLAGPPRTWVPKLISIKNVSRPGQGFSFLVASKYLKLACPREFQSYTEKGFTNTALALNGFWPGKEFLSRAGVLPFMFLQTHESVLEHLDVVSMMEHVYLHYLAEEGAITSPEVLLRAKECLYARHNETGFLTQEQLSRFGVPHKFYQSKGGLRAILKSLATKYAIELGYSPEDDQHWSATEFRRRFPDRQLEKCEYCGLCPVDLHHLLPRQTYPTFTLECDNVVPLCVQAHWYINRRLWSPHEAELYQKSIRRWLSASGSTSRRDTFLEVMQMIHSSIYGNTVR